MLRPHISGNATVLSLFDRAGSTPHVIRTLAALGQYLYSENSDGVAVHMYVCGEVAAHFGDTVVTIKQEAGSSTALRK
ncbi:MAG: hypothetical protein HOF01_05220 [Chloroflexi bacterium]|nr:hypothetical protein [Chloroflexota bacterium]